MRSFLLLNEAFHVVLIELCTDWDDKSYDMLKLVSLGYYNGGSYENTKNRYWEK